jgi:hypothetical protein
MEKCVKTKVAKPFGFFFSILKRLSLVKDFVVYKPVRFYDAGLLLTLIQAMNLCALRLALFWVP